MTIREILLAMIEALDAGDQTRYRELHAEFERLHHEAAARIRDRNRWKIPHP